LQKAAILLKGIGILGRKGWIAIAEG